jgi:hypothetical protein
VAAVSSNRLASIRARVGRLQCSPERGCPGKMQKSRMGENSFLCLE